MLSTLNLWLALFTLWLLFVIAIPSGIYSLVSAVLFVVLEAVEQPGCTPPNLL